MVKQAKREIESWATYTVMLLILVIFLQRCAPIKGMAYEMPPYIEYID
jgi:hypothetical protein